MLTIAVDEVTYKIESEAEVKDTGMETSSNPIIPEAPPSSPTSSSRRPISPPPPPPHPEVGPCWKTIWWDVDFFAYDVLGNPFKRIHDELADL